MAHASKGIQLTIGGITLTTLITILIIAFNFGHKLGFIEQKFEENKTDHIRIESTIKSQDEKITGIHKRIGCVAQVISAHTGKPVSGE